MKGFVSRTPLWLVEPVGPKAARKSVESMESETRRFYNLALEKVTDASTRKLLGDLAEAEAKHTATAELFEKQQLDAGNRKQEDEAYRRTIVLQFVQPGLAGLMDGSVSTLAPLFAAAFATHSSKDAFLVGLAASVGAGISMGFAEALSDDGSLTGRGRPVVRGVITGVMTTAGGIGHTLPYLIPDFQVATVDSHCCGRDRARDYQLDSPAFMETPLIRAALQVVLGGVLVFIAGMLIGKS